MPVDGITDATRRVGILGSIAGLGNLYRHGFFADARPGMRVVQVITVVAMIGAWLLPSRFYGGEGRVPAKAPNASIEPE